MSKIFTGVVPVKAIGVPLKYPNLNFLIAGFGGVGTIFDCANAKVGGGHPPKAGLQLQIERKLNTPPS